MGRSRKYPLYSSSTEAKSRFSHLESDPKVRKSVLLIMACTLSRLTIDDIGQIYVALGIPQGEAQKDMNVLAEQGIVTRHSNFVYYTTIRTYSLTIKAIMDAFLSADSDELQKALDTVSELIAKKWDRTPVDVMNLNLAKAMWKCLHCEPFADDLEKCNSFLTRQINKDNMQLISLLRDMSFNTEWRRFILFLPKDLQDWLRQRWLDKILDMERPYNDDTFHYLYFDQSEHPRHDLMCIEYVLAVELFPKGHIDRLIAKYASTPANSGTKLAEYLRAVKNLEEGNPEPMLAVTLSLGVPGDALLGVPQIGFFALIAAIMSGNPKDAKRLSATLKGVEKFRAPMAFAVIEWLNKNYISNPALKRIMDSGYKPATQMLFAYFVLKCKMDLTNDKLKELATIYSQTVTSGHFDYLKLLFVTLNSDNPIEKKRLAEATGMKGFFSDDPDAQAVGWEKDLTTLDHLLNAMTTGGIPVKQSTERVAYLLDGTRSIRPVLQKSNNGGITWTKGRAIALKTMKEGGVSCMTAQDAAVASHIRCHSGYWGSETYSLNATSALCELIGCPTIFTDDDARLKIEVSRIEPQISVTTEKGGGFKISTNMEEIGQDSIYIDASNPLSIGIMEVSDSQMRVCRALQNMKKLPAEAKERLSEVVGKMSKVVTVLSDVGATVTDEKKKKASKLITVQLIPEGDCINATLFVKPLSPAPPYLTPGKGTEFINGVVDGVAVQARRDLKAEAANLMAVEGMFAGMDDAMTGSLSWQLDIEQTLTVLESLAANPKTGVAEWPEGVKMRISRPMLPSSALNMRLSASGGWFDMQGELKIDERRVLSMTQLLEKMRNNSGRFIQLEGDEYVALTSHLAETLRTLSQLAETSGKKNRLASYSADFLSDLEKEGVDLQMEKHAQMLLERIKEANTAVIRTPSGIQADLRDYQKDGYHWMARLSLWGAGACLADDMGLGKTLQTICLLYADRAKGPSLVVAPTSLLSNWRDEVKRFAPALRLTILNESNDAARRTEIINSAKAGDIVVCSYGLLVNEQETLAAKEWNVAVLDEAHTIKNRDTKMSQAAMTINARMRVALTGTPLQNRLSEIWNIFRFLNPGLLGSFQSFNDRFVIPIERDRDRLRQRLLKRLISPFLLRRTKSDVLNELPPKTEITVRTELSEEERALYESLRRQAELAVSSPDASPVAALAEITRLRLAACNSQLVNPALNLASSKMSAFMEIVENLHSNHHRALVFSQFTSHLALVRKRLEEAGIEYLYLDGSTPAAQRASLVEEFQQSDIPLFLISLKAGGLGLNLTGADYVVHLDPWWNPAIEDQATDRSHRIGQEKPVTVYRIIASDTIEERILELHSHKKSLADALLEGSDMSARLTKEEILSLLKE